MAGSVINFVTFGDSTKYSKSVKRLGNEARSLGIFKNVYDWTERDLDPEFARRHLTYMRCTRGFGYWIWKPQVILQALNRTPDGGFVIYADAGCQFNPKFTPKVMDRLNDYLNMAKANEVGIMGFTLPFIEKQFTKTETVFQVFDELTGEQFSSIMNSAQRVGGINVWHKRPSSLAFVQEWVDVCTRDSYKYVSDSPSIYANSPEFVEHRHDQSIFSLLSKKYNVTVIPDETYHANWHEQGFPIHAARLRE